MVVRARYLAMFILRIIQIITHVLFPSRSLTFAFEQFIFVFYRIINSYAFPL